MNIRLQVATRVLAGIAAGGGECLEPTGWTTTGAREYGIKHIPFERWASDALKLTDELIALEAQTHPQDVPANVCECTSVAAQAGTKV